MGVAFEITPPPTDVYVCHCSICRRASGVHGVAVVVVDNAAFRWVRGEDQIATWRKPGVDWRTWFCRICGSAVPGKNDEARMFIPAGLITEGGEDLKVARHIWTGSKAPWHVIGDDAAQDKEAFGSGG